MAVMLCAIIGTLAVLALVFRTAHAGHSPGFGEPREQSGPKGGQTAKYPSQDGR